jgi:mannose-6-phosphate isomerase
VLDAVRFWDVVPGDVVYLPPGTVHTLCRGVMIYEVQQACDITFRIHDYNRPGPDRKPRELHVDEALDVITFGDEVRRPVSWRDLGCGDEETTVLVESDRFRLERHRPSGGRMEHDAADSFVCLTVIHGSAEVGVRATSVTSRCGDTTLVPAGRPFTAQQAGEEPVEYLMASVP